MTGDQVVFIAAAFILILGISVLAQFHWLPGGKPGMVLVFAAGAAAFVALYLAGLPPSWFEGGKVGFGLALSFLLGAFIGAGGEVRAFRLPFLLSMGLVLLIANVIAAITKRI